MGAVAYGQEGIPITPELGDVDAVEKNRGGSFTEGYAGEPERDDVIPADAVILNDVDQKVFRERRKACNRP
jgi:hypothetical protein